MWDTPSAFNIQPNQLRLRDTDQVPFRPLEKGKTQTFPSVDIEQAHHELNDVIWRLRNTSSVSDQDLVDLIDALERIENLIYRNMK